MSFKQLFPSTIYFGKLDSKFDRKLNQDLLSDCYKLAEIDDEGLEWSEKNYPGGYTSYSSVPNLHLRFSTFEILRKKIDRKVKAYVKKLELDLQENSLEMRTCWVNIMPPTAHHSLHLHPLSVISGTYYVSTPKRASPLKLEDPRLSLFMGRPPYKGLKAPFESFEPQAGHLALFESWMRHEVPAQQGKENRVSISFNYEWV
ncbi:MAG: TIGR02466 family protein [Pseudobdellovibrionaceae bacterium]